MGTHSAALLSSRRTTMPTQTITIMTAVTASIETLAGKQLNQSVQIIIYTSAATVQTRNTETTAHTASNMLKISYIRNKT